MATKNQMALGPHGMAYNLAEFLHAAVWDVNNNFFPQLILITRMALTVDSLIFDEAKISQDDKDEVSDIIEECCSILDGYTPLMEEADGAGLRAISQRELIGIELKLRRLIKRHKLVTQQLLASAKIGRPGEDAAEEVS